MDVVHRDCVWKDYAKKAMTVTPIKKSTRKRRAADFILFRFCVVSVVV